MNLIENFSVIIPLYNKECEIKRTVRSVLAQTVKDFELIIIDDGSTDNGPAKVLEFNDPRIKLISQENKGVSAARNRGISEAQNELISFLDADDEWAEDYLETIIRLRKKYPDAGLYATAYNSKTSLGLRKIKLRGVPAPPWEGLIPAYFKTVSLGDQPFNASTVTIPKKILNAIGGFKEGENLGEDLDLLGRIAMRHPIAFSGKIGGAYRCDASNRINDTAIFAERESPFVKTAFKAIEKGEVPLSIIPDLKDYIAKLQLLVAGRLINGRKLGIARRIILNSHPTSLTVKRKKVILLILTFLPEYLFHLLLKITGK